MRALGRFEEVGIGLGWKPRRVIAVLWAYIDESGEHDAATGNLIRLTLGCAIAKFEAWQALEPEWNSALAEYNLPMFHMADFEARQPPIYDQWEEPKRREVLGRFLSIASKHVPIYLGCNDLPAEFLTIAAFRNAYGGALLKFLLQFEREHAELLDGEDITVVLAKHRDIAAGKICEIFDRLFSGMGERIKFGGVGVPDGLPPLQVADIAAYEFSRTSRQKRPETERYPLRFLANNAKCFTLYSSRFLSEVSEWRI